MYWKNDFYDEYQQGEFLKKKLVIHLRIIKNMLEKEEHVVLRILRKRKYYRSCQVLFLPDIWISGNNSHQAAHPKT